jgi:hypothetical protein
MMKSELISQRKLRVAILMLDPIANSAHFSLIFDSIVTLICVQQTRHNLHCEHLHLIATHLCLIAADVSQLIEVNTSNHCNLAPDFVISINLFHHELNQSISLNTKQHSKQTWYHQEDDHIMVNLPTIPNPTHN